MLKFLNRLTLGLVVLLVLAPAALATTTHPAGTLVFSNPQTWALLIGALVPLVTYVVNHVGPWMSEPVKAFVVVLASGVAGGLYQAIATSSFGWNASTLQMVLTAIFAALAAHHMLWKPAGVSTILGAGSNSPHGHLGWVSPSAEPPAK